MTDSKTYTLEQALDFAGRISKRKSYSELDLAEIPKVLRVLAEEKDETNFKRVVDSYVRLVTPTKDKISRDPLNFLEWLCGSMDHGFANFAYHYALQGKMPEVGEIQGFFRRLYGTHYSLDEMVQTSN